MAKEIPRATACPGSKDRCLLVREVEKSRFHQRGNFPTRIGGSRDGTAGCGADRRRRIRGDGPESAAGDCGRHHERQRRPQVFGRGRDPQAISKALPDRRAHLPSSGATLITLIDTKPSIARWDASTGSVSLPRWSRCFGLPRVGVGAEAPALGRQQAHGLFIEGLIVEGLPGLRHGDPAHFDVSITA